MRTLRILVVEDNAVIGTLLAMMLKEMGHEVCATETTEDGAVAAAMRCNPDLMIVDVTLGSGSGIKAVETIVRTRDVPHIYMSGAPVRTGRAGSVVLQKPFVESDMILAMERAIGASAEA
jgi:DNA-binding response OmpR family regulator